MKIMLNIMLLTMLCISANAGRLKGKESFISKIEQARAERAKLMTKLVILLKQSEGKSGLMTKDYLGLSSKFRVVFENSKYKEGRITIGELCALESSRFLIESMAQVQGRSLANIPLVAYCDIITRSNCTSRVLRCMTNPSISLRDDLLSIYQFAEAGSYKDKVFAAVKEMKIDVNKIFCSSTEALALCTEMKKQNIIGNSPSLINDTRLLTRVRAASFCLAEALGLKAKKNNRGDEEYDATEYMNLLKKYISTLIKGELRKLTFPINLLLSSHHCGDFDHLDVYSTIVTGVLGGYQTKVDGKTNFQDIELQVKKLASFFQQLKKTGKVTVEYVPPIHREHFLPPVGVTKNSKVYKEAHKKWVEEGHREGQLVNSQSKLARHLGLQGKRGFTQGTYLVRTTVDKKYKGTFVFDKAGKFYWYSPQWEALHSDEFWALKSDLTKNEAKLKAAIAKFFEVIVKEYTIQARNKALKRNEKSTPENTKKLLEEFDGI